MICSDHGRGERGEPGPDPILERSDFHGRSAPAHAEVYADQRRRLQTEEHARGRLVFLFTY